MAKKKNVDILEGISRDPETKLTVQKSRPLTALWQSDLNLSEFKILDTYLARINSGDSTKRTVVLSKGELEKALGVTQIKKDDLQQRLKRLYQPIDLAKGDDKRLHLISLFQEAKAEQDEYGLWQIRLTCTESAMTYFFNVEKLGYLRYKLRCITSLTSRYTYIMFVYLEANRFRSPWEVELEELKKILNCHEDELYKEFKMFNQRILKRCQKELHEKTECRFTYEPIRKGRTVSAIRFTLETLPELDVPDVDPNQLSIFSDEAFYAAACTPEGSEQCEFEDAQILQMCSVLVIIPDSKLPDVSHGDIRNRRYHYLAERYAALNVAAARNEKQGKPIKNRFTYFMTMLKKDAGVE